MRLSGEVVLVIFVEPDGSVTNANIRSGHPILGALAIDAVRHWKFAPGPERTTETITFRFV